MIQVGHSMDVSMRLPKLIRKEKAATGIQIININVDLTKSPIHLIHTILIQSKNVALVKEKGRVLRQIHPPKNLLYTCQMVSQIHQDSYSKTI